jgi:plastocyanin
MNPVRRLASVFAAGAISLVGFVGVAPVAGHAAAVAPCGPQVKTHVIGVDNTVPAGHNWEYTDYFPRGLPVHTGVIAANGDCIDFKYTAPQANVDNGFHTATLLTTSENLSNTNPWADTPFAKPETDGGEGGLLTNPAVFFPSSVAPCGDAGNPCVYNGSSRLNSGAPIQGPLNGTGDFVVKLAVGNSPTVTFVCLIHPGMTGTFDVIAPDGVTPTTPPENTNAASTAQYNADTAEATATEVTYAADAVSTNPDGTHTVTMTAGAGTPHTEILEMLPQTVNVTDGDTVKWVYQQAQKEVHTVTFPQGSGSASVDPFSPPQCEGNPTSAPDTNVSGPPPTFGCTGPADPSTPGFNFELPINPAPQGPTDVTSTSTVTSSGILGAVASPFPQTYSYRFPNSGTFAYQCRIHDHMTGVVSAAAAFKAPVLPAAGARGPVTGAGSSGVGLILLALLTLSGLMVGRGLMFLRRRQA